MWPPWGMLPCLLDLPVGHGCPRGWPLLLQGIRPRNERLGETVGRKRRNKVLEAQRREACLSQITAYGTTPSLEEGVATGGRD